jgi:hypothetical protein
MAIATCSRSLNLAPIARLDNVGALGHGHAAGRRGIALARPHLPLCGRRDAYSRDSRRNRSALTGTPPMQSKATTVKQYLAELPSERRAAIEAVRKVVLDNLDKDYEEGMQYGMIGFYVPHRVFPGGYHVDPKQPLPFAALASQKNYMSLYLTAVYGDEGEEGWLRDKFAKAGKSLDMGKSCIRFKRLDELPLDVIGEAIRRVPAKKHIAHYVSTVRTTNKAEAKKAAAKSSSAKASPAKAAARKSAAGSPVKARATKKGTTKRAAG